MEKNESNEKVFLLSAYTLGKSYFREKLCQVIQKQPSSHRPIKQLFCIL